MRKYKECDDREGEKEGSYMVARNLHAIKHALDEIMPLIDEHDDIESWMEDKISTAKQALSSVRDALMYDQDHSGCGCGGDMGAPGGEEAVDIEVISPKQMGHDDFNLGKMMAGMGANESSYFLGSGSINEKRQLITNNSSKKIIVESMKKSGNFIKVKTKSGQEYEYLPHFGTDLEMLRCEDFKIKIKK
jgi:hypothetical protein